MANVVTQDGNFLRCSCGAMCMFAKDRKRFLARHPKTCSERRDFAHQLAQGTRSVSSRDLTFDELMADPEETVNAKHQIEVINSSGRGLTPWEEDFMESITDQMQERGWLTDKQREVLERIYGDRT